MLQLIVFLANLNLHYHAAICAFVGVVACLWIETFIQFHRACKPPQAERTYDKLIKFVYLNKRVCIQVAYAM